MMRLLFLAVPLLICLPLAAQTSAPTIADLLGTPFPLELQASPTERKAAWIRYEKGLRNVYVYSAAKLESRMLTHFAEDDGQELGGLQWSPDGQHILFLRGGAPNSRGEIPNPRSLPDGASRSIWMMMADGSNQRIVAEGAGPEWAPDGQSIVYISKGQVHRIGLDEDAEAEVLLKARGGVGTLRWSPDGTYLAFVSSRGTHSYIGLYDFRSQSIKWLDASLDRDMYPSWSPDGRYLAFARFPTISDVFIFSPKRTAYPWSIRVYDTDLHQGRELWQADAGDGSAYWNIVARDQLIWMKDNSLVFPWEKDGWNHLYSMRLYDTEPQLLTPGEFEVEFVDVSTDASMIVYASNQDDINRRHLWRISVGDSRPTAITRGEGIEWAPSILPDKTVAYLRSDAVTHAHPLLLVNNGLTRSPFIKEAEREYRLVTPEPVTFKSGDGMIIHGQVFLPPDYEGWKQYPAVMFYHGGSRRQMLLGFHKSQYYHNAYAMNQYLANQGVITMSVNYRSGIGYGMEFREALEYGASGASEYRDVLGATLYLRKRNDVDKNRIAIWGGSYGGYLTGLALARHSELFVCGVDIHGVHDWNVTIKNFIPSYEPLKNPKRTALAFESSPMADVEKWTSPVLLIHGDDDRNVPFSESTTLVEKLRENGTYFEQLVFPDEVHGFLLHSNWTKAYEATAEFLLRHLKPGE
jgi:dipeptidyl aminopeptidase/acylaminoacyl peptidase